MVLPVNGPFSKVTSIAGPPNEGGYAPEWLFKTQVWYRQKSPYSEPLSYEMDMRCVLRSAQTWKRTQEAQFVMMNHLTGISSQRVYNAAYAKFMDAVQGASAELGALLGEYKSSWSMIQARANQLYRGFKAAKRGDVSGLRRAWGKHAGIRRRLRSAGSHVLEYSFGWAPLLKDLQGAVEATTKGLPPLRVRRRFQAVEKASVRENGNPTTVWKRTTTRGWELRARLHLENPNEFLAQSLGLTNLASVAWELMPNSYLLDYFVNMSDYIKQWTYADGLVIKESSRTEMIKTDLSVACWWTGVGPWAAPAWEGVHVTVSRSPGLPGITLDFRPPWEMSSSRASTSVARLLQLLKGK